MDNTLREEIRQHVCKKVILGVLVLIVRFTFF